MAPLKNPLFSLTASGRLTRAFTLARRLTGPGWLLRGRPADPKTEPQLSWRTMWQLAAGLWHQLSPEERAIWEQDGTAHSMTGFARYMSQALRPNPGIYLPLAGGTMTGDIDTDGNKVTGLTDPTQVNHAARKGYVDAQIAAAAYTHGARVFQGADYIIPNNDWTVLPYNNERWDTDGMHDNVVQNTRLTCNTAGIYLLVSHVKWDNNLVGRRLSSIRLNGIAPPITSTELAIPGNVDWNMSALTLYPLTPPDFVEAWVYQNSGGNLLLKKSSPAAVEFMAQRVG